MIIYIVGYGRSGSTALSRILEKKLKGINLGEAKFLYRSTYDDLMDPYWVKFKKKHEDVLSRNAYMLKSFDSILGMIQTNRKKYKQFWDDIFSEIDVDPENHVIIDSSKTTLDSFMRGIHLYNCYDQVYFLLPHRSFLDVIQSLLKGDNANLERKKKQIFIKRLLHTAIVGLPHLLLTRILTQIYKFYGMEVIDISNLESEIDRIIAKNNLHRCNNKIDIPMIFGNRNRKLTFTSN